jgi:pyruvate dehydrogenase E2 component (dihydrolipoamide acetyltransferase)
MAKILDMPKLSPTMEEGVLSAWHKNEGDGIAVDDLLAEVETDKATMELESFFDGVRLAIFMPAGSQVPIGAALCAVGKAGEKVSAPAPAAAPAAPAPAAPAAKPAAAPAPAPTPAPAPAPTPAPKAAGPAPAAAAPADPSARVKISPLARRLAAEKGISPAGIAGTGPGGRIVRADILAAPVKGASKGGAAPLGGGFSSAKGPVQEEKTVPVSNIRATIGRRLLESKTQIPHFYLEIEVDVGPLLDLRAQLNSALEKEGVKLSVNDFVLKASAEALRRVPAVNCSWEGAAINQYASAHVSFAVAIEDGLITPVVRDAHLKTIFAISTEVLGDHQSPERGDPRRRGDREEAGREGRRDRHRPAHVAHALGRPPRC